MEATKVISKEDAIEHANQLILLATTENMNTSKVIELNVYAEPGFSVKDASDAMMYVLTNSVQLSNRDISSTAGKTGSHPGRDFTLYLTLK